MNTDLYTLLWFLSLLGLFLAVVVGRMQFRDSEIEQEVADKLEAVKSLEEDYRKLSLAADELGASARSNEILPLLRASGVHDSLSPGTLLRRALAVYEAIEHVDDPVRGDSTYQKTMQELGMQGPSDSQRTDLRSMLRLARETIHAKTNGEELSSYKDRIKTQISDGKIALSDGGKMRLREVLALLHRDDMQALTEEYRDYIPVVEELLLAEPVTNE